MPSCWRMITDAYAPLTRLMEEFSDMFSRLPPETLHFQPRGVTVLERVTLSYQFDERRQAVLILLFLPFAVEHRHTFHKESWHRVVNEQLAIAFAIEVFQRRRTFEWQ